MPAWYEAFGCCWATSSTAWTATALVQCRMSSLFILHLRGLAWSDDIERKMGVLERETAVIHALMHSSRDLTVLSTRVDAHYSAM